MVLTGAIGFGAAYLLGLGGRAQPTATKTGSAPGSATESPTTTAEPTAAPEPTETTGPAPSAEADAAVEESRDAAAPEAPSAEPAVGANGLPPVVDEFGGDGSQLLSYEGYLIVRSRVKADVFVQGVPRGPTNTKLKSRCRQKFVRLRDSAEGQWLTPGQGVRIACMSTTTVTINP